MSNKNLMLHFANENCSSSCEKDKGVGSVPGCSLVDDLT
jgi:hypothetical protein